MKIGAVEAGGTKIICATGTREGEILERVKIDTMTPDKSMPQVIDFFRKNPVEAIGIGTFGPADINEKSPTYGFITTTPKPGWNGYDLRGEFTRNFDVPVAFDTDVNGAVLGEYLWGAAKGSASAVYMTIGTGVGAGAIIDGKILKGISHPEMGHMLVRRHPGDTYKGFCPYHGDCLEGLTAGTAIGARAGKPGGEIDRSDPVWQYITYYIAQALFSIALVLMPERFILGGGVMARDHLFGTVREKFLEISNGYMQFEEVLNGIDSYIVAPGLGGDAGIRGALGLAIALLRRG